MRARPTFIVASILLAVSAHPVHAAEFWWTGDLSNGWNSTETNFDTIVNTNWATLYSGGTDRLALPGASDVVRFAASGAIQLNTAIDRGGASVYGLTTEFLGTTPVSIQSGPLTVGAFGIVMDTPSTLTISSSLLTTASNYGITTANASAALLVTGNMTSHASLTKAGPGLLTLQGINTYTSGTNIVQGTITAAAANALPNNRPLTLGDSANGSTARLNTGGFSQTLSALTIYAPSVINTTVVDVGTGTLTLAGNLTLLNTTNNAGDLWGATIAGSSGSRLDLGGSIRDIILAGQRISQNELVVQPVITNGAIVLNANPSTLDGTAAGMVLAAPAPNTYSGGTRVNAGVLTVNSTTTLGPGPLTLATTGSVESRVRFNNPAQTISGLSTATLGTAIPVIELNGTALTVQSDGTLFAGTITGTGSFTKSGFGTLTLARANTYSGGTTVAGGTLAAAAANALPLGRPLTIGQASTATSALVTTGGFAQTISGLTLFARSGVAQTAIDVGSGTLTLNGDVTLLDTQDFQGNQYGAIIAAGPGGTLNLGGGVRNITLAGQNVLQQELTVNAVITNGGINLTANPSSTVLNAAGMVLNASAPNTYAGGTTVNAGVLTVNPSTTLGPGGLTLNNISDVECMVRFNNPVQTIASLSTDIYSATPVIELNGTALTVNQSTFTNFGGRIQGTGSLTRTGSGSLILSGDNTYTGGTIINSSSLGIGYSDTGSIVGDVSLISSSVVVFVRPNDFTFSGEITGDGSVYVSITANINAPTVIQAFTGNIDISGIFDAYGLGIVVLDTPVTVDTLQVFSDGISVELASGGDNTLAMSELSIPNTKGTLVTHDNDLIMKYTGASPIATLIGYLNTNQLIPTGDCLGLPTYLAIAEAADLGLTTFAGQPVDDSTVLAKYTYVGDANLDGQVDALDYERVDLAIGNSGVFGTAQGDLNYDGIVDALDYEQIDLNIGNGVGSPLAGVFIPEPASLSLVAVGAALMGRRRRA